MCTEEMILEDGEGRSWLHHLSWIWCWKYVWRRGRFGRVFVGLLEEVEVLLSSYEKTWGIRRLCSSFS